MKKIINSNDYNGYRVLVKLNDEEKLEVYNAQGDSGVLFYLESDECKEILKNFPIKELHGEINDGYLDIVTWISPHRHSEYSLLDSACSVENMVKNIKYASALTDHDYLHGWIEFYKKMVQEGKKPILGVELHTETLQGEKYGNHLVLLVKNKTGYKNLIKLVSECQNNFYRKPHASYEMLKKYSEGLICTTACISSEIARAILAGNFSNAENVIQTLKDIYKDDLYLEIQRHGIPGEEFLNEKIQEYSKKYEIKIVAADDSHYVYPYNKVSQEILTCVNDNKTFMDSKRRILTGDGYHLCTCDDMEQRFIDIPEALYNTLEIAEKVEFELTFHQYAFPNFEIPAEYSSQREYLRELAEEGFEERFKEQVEKFESEEYRDRLNYELSVVETMGYEGYFLIVWDLINFAKSKGILTGQRGSSGSSLLCYCLKISNIDPIEYGLMFERFMDPARVSMPDIDADFQYDRREEVIQYIETKYGDKSTAKIGSMGRFGARAVVRSVAKTLYNDVSLGDKIAKMIPKVTGITLNEAGEINKAIITEYNANHQVKNVIDESLHLEGLAKNKTIHASGILIAPGDITDYVPIVNIGEDGSNKKKRASQWNMTECEEMGLVKIDVLGLRTLTVIALCRESIQKEFKELEINWEELNLYDPMIYKNLIEGNTAGVFQLSSDGMTEFIKELYQDLPQKLEFIQSIDNEIEKNKQLRLLGKQCFNRLIDGIAIYRPGPIAQKDKYIKQMLNPDKIEYLHPKLEEILKGSNGVIIFQEDVMKIVHQLAGFSRSQMDMVRRVICKKDFKKLPLIREMFVYGSKRIDDNLIKEGNGDAIYGIEGCVNLGIEEEIALKIWDLLETFGSYAFNKSHSVAYAVMAASTAYLNYHFKSHYMASILSSVSDKDKMRAFLGKYRNVVKIKTPDVNESFGMFVANENNISFGLNSIKQLGRTGDIIEKERENGKYVSLGDFISRVSKKDLLDTQKIAALIDSGALSCFGYSKYSLYNSIEEIKGYSKIKFEESKKRQLALDDLIKKSELNIKNDEIEFGESELIQREYESLGAYITRHPLDKYEKYLKNTTPLIELSAQNMSIDGIASYDEVDSIEETSDDTKLNGKEVFVAGVIKEIKEYRWSNGAVMARIDIEDRTGKIKCVAFPNEYYNYKTNIFVGAEIIIHGRVQINEYGLQIVTNSINSLIGLKEMNEDGKMVILGENDQHSASYRWRNNKSLCDNYKTETDKTIVYFYQEGKHYKLSEVDLNDKLWCLLIEANTQNKLVKYMA